MADNLTAALFSPHEEAAATVASKPVVAREVFDQLLPELRARAFTVAGVEGANTVQRIKDEITDFTRGQTADGEARTWDQAKAAIVQTLDDANFSPAAAERRATILLRTHAFQAYQSANWKVAQADADTTHLQYLATEDSHVRDSHLALNGLVFPKGDVFWNGHYPPWEWGCRCRVRPINPDQLAEQKAIDAQRKPEDRLVLEGAALEQARQGQVVRGELKDRDGRTVAMGTHNVTPPSQQPGGDKAFSWHPDNLRMPLDQILGRYDPEVRDQFLAHASQNRITPQVSVLDWLEGRALPTRPDSKAGGSGDAGSLHLSAAESWAPIRRVLGISNEEGARRLKAGKTIESDSGNEVRFGKIVSDHFGDSGSDRPRSLPQAEAVAAAPTEIWEVGNRRYYIGRTKTGAMVVIAARTGTGSDEVITYYPVTLAKLKKFRRGKLIYQK